MSDILTNFNNFIIDVNNFTIICKGCHKLEKIPLKVKQKEWCGKTYGGDPHQKAKQDLLIHAIEIVIKNNHSNCFKQKEKLS